MRLPTLKFMMYVALALALGGCGGGSSTPTTPISVAIGGGSSTIMANGTFSLTAVVSGDPTGAGVAWTLTGAGTLTLQTSTSATYQAPTTVPADATVRITATSLTDGTKSNVLPFSIVAEAVALQCQASTAPRGNESALTTPVAFLLKGSEPDAGLVAYVGSFTADGKGGITAGDVDVVGSIAGSEELPVTANASSYSYGSDGRGCLFLQFGAANSEKAPAKSTRRLTDSKYFTASHGFTKRATGAGQRTPNSDGSLSSLTLSFALSSPTGPGRIIEVSDGNGQIGIIAGQLHAQAPTDFSVAKLSSRYAFGADGWSPIPSAISTGGYFRAAIAGSFANSDGNWSLGVADENIFGTLSEMSGGEGGVDPTIDSTTGRGTGRFETGQSGSLDFDFTYYIVNGGDFYFISNDDPTGPVGLLAGRALEAAATSSPLNGYYITASSGLGLCESCQDLGGNFPTISTMHATSAGSATGSILGGDPRAVSPTPYTWSYTFDAASGRVAFAGGSSLPIAYLTSGNSDDGIVAFTVGTDGDASSGFIASAGTSAPNFTAASLSGSYAFGSAEDASASIGAAAGLTTFDGTSAYTVLADTIVVGNVGIRYTPGASSSGTYVVHSDGTGTLDTPSTVFVTNGNLIVAFDNSALDKLILQIYIKQSTESGTAKIKSK
jgi:hypothetical protein